MRPLTAIAAWILLFLLFLAVRFPYRTVFDRTVSRIEAATGADLTWEQADVGPLGVELSGFSLRMPSGARFDADRARFHPAWGGLSATFVQTQADGRATAHLNGSLLTLHAEKLQVQTGSRDLGTVVTTGDLDYSLSGREGKGQLRMVLPALKLPLPIPEAPLEVGAKVAIKPVAGAGPAGPAGTDVTSDISLYGEELSGEGTVRLQSTPGGRAPSLSGNLQIKSPFGAHAVRLGGTWGRPEWNLAQGANS